VFHFFQEHRVFVELKDVCGGDFVPSDYLLQRFTAAFEHQCYVKGQSV
jgi:hypothetical protein